MLVERDTGRIDGVAAVFIGSSKCDTVIEIKLQYLIVLRVLCAEVQSDGQRVPLKIALKWPVMSIPNRVC